VPVAQRDDPRIRTVGPRVPNRPAGDPARSDRETFVFGSSTRVQQAWYTESEKLVEVLFPDGVRWLFFDVDVSTWQRFTRSESAGRFLHEILERHANRQR
jgi:hypothetical protein